MKLLLDTSAFLCFVGDLPKLSPNAQRHIFDLRNNLYLSVVSAWELGHQSWNRQVSTDATYQNFYHYTDAAQQHRAVAHCP